MFIIIYDDGDMIICPQTWADDCEGAVTNHLQPSPIAGFATKEAARKALAITKRWHLLLKEQGKIHDEAYFEPRFTKFYKIVPLELKEQE